MHDIQNYETLANDPIEVFAKDFLKDGLKIPLMVPGINPLTTYDGATSIVIYQRDAYQVELIAVPPNTIIPEHGHPNIDSIEVYLGGRFQFSLDGKYVSQKKYEL